MRWMSIFALVAAFVVGGLVQAEECQTQAKLTKVQAQVTRLLESWKGAAAQQAKLTPAQQTELAAALQATTQNCPVGSRMHETLGFVRDSLAAAVKAEETLSKACSGDASDVDAACKDASIAQVVAARAKLLEGLHRLATYGAGPSADKSVSVSAKQAAACEKAAVAVVAKKGFCEKTAATLAKTVRGSSCEKSAAKALIAGIPSLQCEKTAAVLVASVKGAGCEKSAAALIVKAATPVAAPAKKACDGCPQKAAVAVVAKKGDASCAASSCCAALTAVSTGLKASWKQAEIEWNAFTPAQRAETGGQFAALAERSDAIKIYPATAKALTEGVQVLDEITRHLQKVVAENPALQKALSAEGKAAFEAQVLRIREANEVLQMVDKLFGKAAEVDSKLPTF